MIGISNGGVELVSCHDWCIPLDRLVAEVRALNGDPEANAAAIRRVREVLPEQ